MTGAIDAAELFAGEMEITKHLQQAGYTALPFEIRTDPMFDMLTPCGFLIALSMVLRMGIQHSGFLWMAPVCSTWVFMSSGCTLRSRLNPEGDVSLECVRKANVMASRCIALALIANSLSITWALEQPSSSTMVFYKRFQQLIRSMNTYMAGSVHMGSYGGGTRKTLKIYSNAAWIGELQKPLPKNFKAQDKSVSIETVRADGFQLNTMWGC